MQVLGNRSTMSSLATLCEICAGSLSEAVTLGGCGHCLCKDCARKAAGRGMGILSEGGAVQLPLPSLGSGLFVDSALVGSLVPGLLCPLCIRDDASQRAYARAFGEAVLRRELPTPELLAFTAAVCPDESSWLATTARHGLPPGWITPAAFDEIRASAKKPEAHLAAFERAVVPAALLIASLVRGADMAAPAAAADGGREEDDAAGAAATGPGVVTMRRAASAVRPVPCPNAPACMQLLAIGKWTAALNRSAF